VVSTSSNLSKSLPLLLTLTTTLCDNVEYPYLTSEKKTEVFSFFAVSFLCLVICLLRLSAGWNCSHTFCIQQIVSSRFSSCVTSMHFGSHLYTTRFDNFLLVVREKRFNTVLSLLGSSFL
jgi:hypothetical protein